MEEFLLSDDDFSDLQPGDLLDVSQYRGTGIWFFDGADFFRKYGYFLPEEAFVDIQKYGKNFFVNSPCYFVLIPKQLKVYIDGTLGTDKPAIGIGPLRDGNEEGEIDNVMFANCEFAYLN